MSHTHPLVDTRFLAGKGPEVRIADVRWSLTGPGGWEKYRQGHIPGAVFVDLDRDLSRPGGPGRHPFPATEDFARFLGRIGVGPQTHVVAYDDAGGSTAARLWFLLKVHGHERASVLDGGFPAWKSAGLPVTTGLCATGRESTNRAPLPGAVARMSSPPASRAICREM